MQNGNLEFTGAMRAKEMMFCPVGALAMFLITRWDLAKKEIPDFQSRKKWYSPPLTSRYVMTELQHN